MSTSEQPTWLSFGEEKWVRVSGRVGETGLENEDGVGRSKYVCKEPAHGVCVCVFVHPSPLPGFRKSLLAMVTLNEAD